MNQTDPHDYEMYMWGFLNILFQIQIKFKWVY